MERIRISSDFFAAVHPRSKSMLDSIVECTRQWCHITLQRQKKVSSGTLGSARPLEGPGPRQPDQANGHAVFRLTGPHLYSYSPQWRRHQCHLHHQGPGSWTTSRRRDPPWPSSSGGSTGTNAPVHTATSMMEWMAAKGIQVKEHLPYSADSAPADV